MNSSTSRPCAMKCSAIAQALYGVGHCCPAVAPAFDREQAPLQRAASPHRPTERYRKNAARLCRDLSRHSSTAGATARPAPAGIGSKLETGRLAGPSAGPELPCARTDDAGEVLTGGDQDPAITATGATPDRGPGRLLPGLLFNPACWRPGSTRSRRAPRVQSPD